MKKVTRLKFRLHLMMNNSVVIDTTHWLIPFPQMTMQVETQMKHLQTPASRH